MPLLFPTQCPGIGDSTPARSCLYEKFRHHHYLEKCLLRRSFLVSSREFGKWFTCVRAHTAAGGGGGFGQWFGFTSCRKAWVYCTFEITEMAFAFGKKAWHTFPTSRKKMKQYQRVKHTLASAPTSVVLASSYTASAVHCKETNRLDNGFIYVEAMFLTLCSTSLNRTVLTLLWCETLDALAEGYLME